jgi:hypothetical protein
VTAPRPTSARFAVAGVLLVLLGLGFWTLYWLRSGTEDHSFSRNPIPPTDVHLTKGKTYDLAVPGGVPAEQSLGLDPASVQCTITASGAAGGTELAVLPESATTKATNQIASFIAPFTGRAHVQCRGLPPVFIDNADDAPADLSGLWIVLSTVALTVGIPLLISALRSAGQPRPVAPAPGSGLVPGEDEEIEGFVDRTRRGVVDREVGNGDTGDVRT